MEEDFSAVRGTFPQALMGEEDGPWWARSDQRRVEGDLVARRPILLFSFPRCASFFFFLNSEMSFLCFKNFLPEQISF